MCHGADSGWWSQLKYLAELVLAVAPKGGVKWGMGDKHWGPFQRRCEAVPGVSICVAPDRHNVRDWRDFCYKLLGDSKLEYFGQM